MLELEGDMDIFINLAIVVLCGLTCGCYQTNISLLMLLSSRSIGQKSHSKQLQLVGGLLLGSLTMLVLEAAFVVLILNHLLKFPIIQNHIWEIIFWGLIATGVIFGLFYFKGNKSGTSLWFSKSFKHFLLERSRITDSIVESYSLGLTGIISEILFYAIPLLLNGIVILESPFNIQLYLLAIFAIIAIAPLIMVWLAIELGCSLTKVQKWREDNKTFIRFINSFVLLLLAIVVYIIFINHN